MYFLLCFLCHKFKCCLKLLLFFDSSKNIYRIRLGVFKPIHTNVHKYRRIYAQNTENYVSYRQKYNMIISCISYKGGVGKSTISQNLAVCFANASNSVCVIDADESQNTAYWAEARPEDIPEITVVKLTNDKTIAIEVSKLYNDYDYIIIDSPPSQSVIADKIIMLSHIVLVPVTPKGSSEVNTAEQFMLQVQNLEVLKEKKIPTFFVINEFDPRPILHRQFVERFQEFKVPPVKTIIHKRVAYGEANLFGKGVFEHSDPKAKKEITQLFNEIMDISDKL